LGSVTAGERIMERLICHRPKVKVNDKERKTLCVTNSTQPPYFLPSHSLTLTNSTPPPSFFLLTL